MNQTSYAYPKEAAVVDRIRRELSEKYPGCKFMKTSGEGEPDLVGSVQGKTVVIECKQVGKRPTVLQYARLKEWAVAGASAYWSNGLSYFRILPDGKETVGHITLRPHDDVFIG